MAADTRHQSSVDEGNGVMAAGAGCAPLSFVHQATTRVPLLVPLRSHAIAVPVETPPPSPPREGMQGRCGERRVEAAREEGEVIEEEQHGKKRERGKVNEGSGARREG